MLDIDSGTATYSKAENSDDRTGNFGGQATKSYFYKKAVSEIDSTSSAVDDKLNKSKNTVGNRLENTSTGENFLNSDAPVRTIRNIYFQSEFITPELRTAINLLETSQNYIEEAINSIQQGKRKDSDEYIMQFKELLPELFCCRTISESFGAVINAIHNAMSNMKGQPLSEGQIVALKEIITALLREPAMSFDKAVDCVSDFEDADYEVESAGLEGLLKLVEMMNEDEMELNNG